MDNGDEYYGLGYKELKQTNWKTHMEIILALFITYLIGIFVMAGIIRWAIQKKSMRQTASNLIFVLHPGSGSGSVSQSF